jgi:hypothetical protein
MNELGRQVWVIAEGYIPSQSSGDSDALESHETACILNAGTKPADIEVMLYFADRDPVGPYHFQVAPQRTCHLRFNDFENPPVPRDTDYASIIRASVPVVVQHTRLDSRQAALALLSAVAYSQD